MMTSTIRHRATDAILRVTRAYFEELLPDILEGRIEPGRVFDRTVDLDGYRAMADREVLKVMIKP
jgi:threonine dehydrogenase-like Zn-dependent dehydrogenase